VLSVTHFRPLVTITSDRLKKVAIMSANEVYGPGNAPAPPLCLPSATSNDQADARPGAYARAFIMPDAPVGVQQDWYTHAAGQALMYAQNGAASASHRCGPGGGAEGQHTETYASQLQRPPFICAVDTEGHEVAPSMRRAQFLDSADDPAGHPYTSPAQNFEDMDMPLAIGSHPYAARPGSTHRRRIGVYHQPDPGEAERADQAPEHATDTPDCPDSNQGAPAWEEKQTICFYCKTENWPRRTFCYMCRRDFASGWWHPDGCSCGDC
jgi:hypothetical protein